MRWQLKHSVGADGLWYEGTMAYQFYALSAIMETGGGRLRHSLSEAALDQVRKRIPERFKSARMMAVLTGTEGS